MYGESEPLTEEDMLGVLQQQLPPEMQKVNSVEELLQYTISHVKAERDLAVEQYIDTKKLIENARILSQLEDGSRAYIDAGNNVYLPAKLNSNRLLINIGYQFHVEMELGEAEAFCMQKLQLLESKIDALNRKLADQRAQAFIIAETLCNMSNLM